MSDTGNIIYINHSQGISIQKIIDDFFNWFTLGKIKISKSPSKCVFIVSNDNLTDNSFENISSEIQNRVNYRKDGFDKLVSFIGKTDNHAQAICKHLNIEFSK